MFRDISDGNDMPSAPLPNKINDNLFISDWESARNRKGLQSLGITHVVSAVGFKPAFPDTFKYHVLHVDDDDAEDMVIHFQNAYEFMKEAHAGGGKILVHCAAGISRSSTIACMYLMRSQNVTFKDALETVRRARNIVQPNPGFARQLDLWSRMNYNTEGSSHAHKHYRVMKWWMAHRKPLQYRDWRAPVPDPAFVTLAPSVQLYKCLDCKRNLFSEDNITVHSFVVSSPTVCDKDVLFIEPLPWMQHTSTSDTSLKCPGCDSTIGSRHLMYKYRCDCGELWAPSIRVKKDRVEVVPSKV